MVIQDGGGPIDSISRALDNLTISADPLKKLPPFVAIAVQNGSDRDGSVGQGSERGLEYDTLSDRYSRFVDTEGAASGDRRPDGARRLSGAQVHQGSGRPRHLRLQLGRRSRAQHGLVRGEFVAPHHHVLRHLRRSAEPHPARSTVRCIRSAPTGISLRNGADQEHTQKAAARSSSTPTRTTTARPRPSPATTTG